MGVRVTAICRTGIVLTVVGRGTGLAIVTHKARSGVLWPTRLTVAVEGAQGSLG